ncbi:pre-mRNA-splicing factor ATP-dependent RNA helicase [Tripterygium wilfordii]|uniref:Pre-mRNA-splicing factor ATP-dependent RNA helicase n=1 Tax=Tripterygium wilfordii TaxID=458696 RepID=A0A7J7DLJ7_TRIWF|nr:probable pre-mRNA-splicing factor ATP-dependent RNA helicase DEAH5 [Tripterygium wilfordii]KAF5747207.1 pre-mRNA-splicing factor ATP-dependent RNA helicase [Tripterygium wilfordii]
MAALNDTMKKLEYFSLVSKVCSELETHIGSNDVVLAEFITELGSNSENFDQFDEKLKDYRFELPDYFVHTLLTFIHAILRPNPKPEKECTDYRKKMNYGALAIVDSKERVKELEKEIIIDRHRVRRGMRDGDMLRDRERYTDQRNRHMQGWQALLIAIVLGSCGDLHLSFI